jgi:hypothetical protein
MTEPVLHVNLSTAKIALPANTPEEFLNQLQGVANHREWAALCAKGFVFM